MLFRLLLTVLITTSIYAFSASPLVIDKNSIFDPVLDYCVLQDGITVNSGVYFSIFVGYIFTSDIVTIQPSASFYVTAYRTGGTELESLTNFGLTAILNPNNYHNIAASISGSKFENHGDMFVTNSSLVDLIAEKWINTGRIVIQGPVVKTLPVVTISSSGSPQLENVGDIFLQNQYFNMEQQLYGGGCIHVIDYSILFLQKMNPSDPLDSIIVLDGSQAILGYTPCGSTTIVAGFGGNNIIEICDDTMRLFNYDVKSGILAITTDHITDFFNIGLGYDPSKFGMGGRQIWYTDLPLNANPLQCSRCPSPPIAPDIQKN